MSVATAAVNNVHGSPVFSDGHQSTLRYSITGDGTGGDVPLSFGRLNKVLTVDSPYPFTISQSTKLVTITVPASLAAGKVVEVKLNGF